VLEQEDHTKPDTHPVPPGNYVIRLGNYVTVNPSQLGNSVIVHILAPRWRRRPPGRQRTPRSRLHRHDPAVPPHSLPTADETALNALDRARGQRAG
jgi:hypothetical protein